MSLSWLQTSDRFWASLFFFIRKMKEDYTSFKFQNGF